MKTVKILVISVSIFLVLIISLIIGYNIKSKIKEAKEGKETLINIIEEAKTKYNFTMNKNDYEIEVIGYQGGYVFKSPPPIYGIKKRELPINQSILKSLKKYFMK